MLVDFVLGLLKDLDLSWRHRQQGVMWISFEEGTPVLKRQLME